DCYNRFVDLSHGMIEETVQAREIGWELGGGVTRWLGYEKDGRILGYLTFRFVKGGHDSFIDNQMHAILAVYESPRVLSQLLTFLHSQFDQIGLIKLRTFDDNFHHLLKDPRNSSRNLIPSVYHETHKSGTGIMYRIVDTQKLFELLADHNFGWQSCKLKLTTEDSFMPANNGSLVLHFDGGKPQLMASDAEHDVELTLNAADMSSLIMGAIDLKSLYDYNLAVLSDDSYLDTLHKLFAADSRPICTTDF
ncbi:MAG: sterol carrier protein domain-containing protein, partial [candidate division Zixibacteria bacterium]|nr:sterol carrier protein domain-containing protein [candidate division Zixibacteria bacterium]